MPLLSAIARGDDRQSPSLQRSITARTTRGSSPGWSPSAMTTASASYGSATHAARSELDEAARPLRVHDDARIQSAERRADATASLPTTTISESVALANVRAAR